MRVGQQGGKHPGVASDDLVFNLAVVRVRRDLFLQPVKGIPRVLKLAHSRVRCIPETSISRTLTNFTALTVI